MNNMDAATFRQYLTELKQLRQKFSSYNVEEMRMHVTLFDKMAKANLSLANVIKEYEDVDSYMCNLARKSIYILRLNDLREFASDYDAVVALKKLGAIRDEYLFDCSVGVMTEDRDFVEELDRYHDSLQIKMIGELDQSSLNAEKKDWKEIQKNHELQEEARLRDLLQDQYKGMDIIFVENDGEKNA